MILLTAVMMMNPMILLMMTGPTIVPMMTVMTVLTMMEPTIVPMMMEVMTTPAIIRLFYESHHFVSRPDFAIYGASSDAPLFYRMEYRGLLRCKAFPYVSRIYAAERKQKNVSGI